MPLPNFLIIGAAKSGTTSLANYLNQHPQVFIPPNNKEPNFFILEGLKLPFYSGPVDSETLYEKIFKYSVTDLDSYRALFDYVSQETAYGEASVPYLYFPQAAKRIKKYIPNVRMIVILRNPVDRLYSHYLMVRENYLLESLSLLDAIEQEGNRIRNNWGWDWHYVRMGMYYGQIKYYFNHFSKEQFKIVLYDDYCTNPTVILKDIYRFIDVDDSFCPNLSKKNKVSFASKSLRINRSLNSSSSINTVIKRILPPKTYNHFISIGNRWNRIPAPSMPPNIRRRLKSLYLEDIFKLQELINRDLSKWT